MKIDHSVRKLGVVRRRLLPLIEVTKQAQGEFTYYELTHRFSVRIIANLKLLEFQEM